MEYTALCCVGTGLAMSRQADTPTKKSSKATIIYCSGINGISVKSIF
jgi:hypothetical protein